MCQHDKLNGFPEPGKYEVKTIQGLEVWQYGDANASGPGRLVVMTDIYGCNEFYQSFATYYAGLGWQVYLINLFSELGELPEITREAAFERRHKLRDNTICTQVENLLETENIDALIGFCLGGNYALELARREVRANLVAYDSFPAGLPNQDGVPVPFEYLEQLSKKVTILAGDADDSAGRENVARLADMSSRNSNLDMHVYKNAGHGFLKQLNNKDSELQNSAKDSLAVCTRAIEGKA